MAKKTSQFVCVHCGTVHAKWVGKCTGCGLWDGVKEESLPQKEIATATMGTGGVQIDFFGLDGAPEILFRLKSNIKELDRVCGGGLVPGSVVLVGGDPGIGKSTLLLQTVSQLSQGVNKYGSPTKCIYISGEESVDQVRLRAMRLNAQKSPVLLASTMYVRDIVATLAEEKPDIVVIDSIQTMYSDTLDSAPGTVGQVRASSHELLRLAKRYNFVLFLVGHVTKEGTMAGPRVLEHMVDTVLYFEGDRGHHFRILRSVKNRFGATDEIGVFEMQERGLMEVPNPSALFLAERQGNVAGSCVYAGMEGTRPVLVEIQALIAPQSGSVPRRAVVGCEASRLNMILAVLETRCKITFSNADIYLNVAGGLKIADPACDLALAVALISSHMNKPVPADMIAFGEIGLSGEVRAVVQANLRVKEAVKMGFTHVLAPKNRKSQPHSSDVKINEIGHLTKLIQLFGL